MPELSVILPARNAQATIERAVSSTLAAMPADSELVVANDGSTDATSERALKGATRDNIVDPRLRIIEASPGPGGVSRVLNQLLAATDSRLVGRMDADDISLKSRFTRTIAALERGDDMVFTQMIELRGRSPRPRIPYEITPEHMRLQLLLTNPVCHPTMLATRKILDQVGGYRQVPAEDYDLWLRVAGVDGRIRRLGAWGLIYRIHPSQVTASTSWRRASWDNPEQAEAFADLSYQITGQRLPRLVSLAGLDEHAQDKALHAFSEAVLPHINALDARASASCKRRLSQRIAWVRSHRQQGESS
ncbi:glycosyltransferase family 2 protein [Schaalia vaccimaxillae]|uniref:glycosyltransferase family 2 protein n=1 Tax=Schaalia vaccimaxillae TaxID=183916 RepID=UPI0003B357E7|nr:glycosyltransferase family 2 protein [Schaalia vaccimaxillae]